MKKLVVLRALVLAMAMPLVCEAQSGWHMQSIPIPTRWDKDVNPAHVLPEYPRPMMVRPKWQNLNGLWDYAITAADASAPTRFDGQILVPYPIESALSGVKKSVFPNQLLWYQRTIAKPSMKGTDRVLLHFGAIDWQATVYVNGDSIGRHEGGYESFSLDITDALKKPQNTLLIKVFDPTDFGPNPHGKQTLNPANIFYTPSSGIWQTVWLEVVPATYIANVRSTPDIDHGVLNVSVTPSVSASTDLTVELTARANGKVVGTATGAPGSTIALSVPNAHLWSPDDPFLYDLTVQLRQGSTTVDQVTSYFGMRKIAIQKDAQGKDRIFLNNRYTYNLGTLDQGFWPDGLLTAPTDEALAFDIKAIKAMGFNTIRKHIKVEPARWYYHADHLGMLVWQDFVNPAFDLPDGAKAEFEKESAAILDQLHNYPCITTWVLFNERWGSYDQKRLTEWVKATDPSRLVDGHSGELLYVDNHLRAPSDSPWVSSDIADVHSYPSPMPVPLMPGKASVVGEFGGIGVPIDGHVWNDLTAGWGYGAGTVTPQMMEKQYSTMLDSLKTLSTTQGISGSIYTQPYDVESEQNGLMTYDREVIKLPVATLRAINARVWPTTANVATATRGLSITVAEPAGPDYAARLAAFQHGKRDSAFLRSLALLASGRKDTTNARLVSTAAIAHLHDPMSANNLAFIRAMTQSTHDTGFRIFSDHMAAVDSVLGKDAAAGELTYLIEKDDILPKVAESNGHPDWTAIHQAVVSKYGDLGDEISQQSRMLYDANHGDWADFGASSGPWFEKYGCHRAWITPRLINQIAWGAFQSTADTAALQVALTMIRQALTVDNSPGNQDTEANLLYRLGKKDEALAIEGKAAENDSQGDIKANLEKMKNGEPTWPTK